ncbi:alpha/beta hydrolase [Geodermatophilus poikilotrophus]|uniref:Alpha/beta hydrolase n=1 Tax=Geodermatophilus poikilotrophus TaxID=1333667 RepID=A0A1I0EYS2_9ACTN|nr:alpha/beta hydrolase [Geodermatophilus poikilotrophus]SET50846.1 Alpha/beta hydrolase [Geodermatophilus poikilotrophus]
MSVRTLAEVAGWDVPLLRGAVWTLDSVAGGLPAWRARVEAVGRSLEDASCWYGPAAQAAGAALVEVSTVATAVTAALDESLEHAQRLLAEAETAQELAERALAAAASVPVVLDGAGRLVALPVVAVGAEPGVGADRTAVALQAQELAEDASAAAARGDRAAGEAEAALTRLGMGGGSAPVTFTDLLGTVVAGAGRAAVLPPPGGPDERAAWWAGLSTADRSTAISEIPGRIGRLDGVPAWARDQGNRVLVERALADPSLPGHAIAVSVAAEITRKEVAGEDVQLLQFQPEEGLVALAVGDLDTADHVALLVPGTGQDPSEDLAGLVGDAGAVAGVATAAAPAAAVATIAWMGYRAPSNLTKAPSPHHSWPGGRALDATLDGLASARAETSGGRPHTTVIGHSYGTLVIDRAADAPGRLAADDVVLLGSPGMDNRAVELEVERVYEASAPVDPITWAEFHGEQTWEDSYGAIELPTDPVMMHWEYYDEWFPTLTPIGEVVGGVREPA